MFLVYVVSSRRHTIIYLQQKVSVCVRKKKRNLEGRICLFVCMMTQIIKAVNFRYVAIHFKCVWREMKSKYILKSEPVKETYKYTSMYMDGRKFTTRFMWLLEMLYKRNIFLLQVKKKNL